MWSQSLYLSRLNTLGVLKIEEYLFKELFDTKYFHQIPYLLDACAHHTVFYPVQRVCLSWYYIAATAVYLIQHFITPASWLCDHRVCISLRWIVLRVCYVYVYFKSTSTRWKSGLRLNIHVHKVTPGIIYAWCVCSSYCCLSGATCVPVIVKYQVYNYITATAVYVIQRFMTTCVVVTWSHSLYL